MIRYYKIVTNIVLFIICENNMGSSEVLLLLKRLVATSTAYIRSLTLVFFGCSWRYISLLGPCLSMTLTAKAIICNWKATAIILPIIFKVKIMPLVIYGLGGVHTHAYILPW